MIQKSSQGNILGGSLMIAGCCIGAGMLGLPVITAQAGFLPSVIFFFCSWLFMTCTGLLVLEVNLWFKDEVSFITMAGKTLGRVGQAVSWLVFLFLFYCLMVAYSAATGSLVADFFNDFTGKELQPSVASLICIIIFGTFIFFGTKSVDWFNRVLMLGLVVSYLLLIAMGSSYVDTSLLKRHDWSAAFFVFPVMIISFGFHNLIPTLTNYFEGNVSKLRTTIILGSAIPLIVYLVWEWLILGIIPLDGTGGFKEALSQEEIATHALRTTVGSSWVVVFAEYFAFFAIVTSFLSVALSFVDFLADGFQIPKNVPGKILLCSMVLLPPFFFALTYPQVFLSALNIAGGFGAVTIFGILPALMVWVGRYKKKLSFQPLVPGGRVMLAAIIVFSLIVMFLEFAFEMGWR